VAILSHRLHRTVALLGLPRLVILAMTPTRVRCGMIMGVRMGFCYRERGFFKEMMNTVRRRGREKKNEEGDDPDGATRT
jgi:hypothetical protein